MHRVRTADHLVQTLQRFARRAARAETRLNELNVFPVADRDTGTNVRKTIESIVNEVGSEPPDDLAKLVRTVGQVALRSSRGNSGLILGQYLTGFFDEIVEDPWPEEWVGALQAGAVKARAAVDTPEEGTILTVADAAARATGTTVPQTLIDAASRADQAVIRTQFQLDVLTHHGVVDAGGVALSLFLGALADVVSNEPEFTIADRVVTRPARRKGDADPVAVQVVVGYELQFNCALETVESADHLQEMLRAFGSDVVVASDGDTLAAHVHAPEIGEVIEAILGLRPFNIRVEALLETRAGRM